MNAVAGEEGTWAQPNPHTRLCVRNWDTPVELWFSFLLFLHTHTLTAKPRPPPPPPPLLFAADAQVVCMSLLLFLVSIPVVVLG